MSRTALVTGAGGFIGGHLRIALEGNAWKVVTLGRGTGGSIDASTLRDISEAVTLIVHCAGGSSVAKSIADPARDFSDTLPPLVAVLDEMRTRWKSASLVLLSSAAVYGATAALPITEQSSAAPISPYGHHKRMAELLCESYGRSFDVRSVVLRLFSVYGPGLRKQLFWDASRKAEAGESTFAGTGAELRDWLHVRDACALVEAAASQASRESPVFNGGSGKGVSVRDAVHALYRELGAAGAPSFDGSARAGDPPNFVAGIAKARSIGWEPRIPFAEGIAEYARWFRAGR